MMISNKVKQLKYNMVNEERYASIEQAKIVTRIYKENESKSIKLKRALSLKAALEEIVITIRDEELIVGNRTKGLGRVLFFLNPVCHGLMMK